MSSASALSLDLIWARDRILDRFQTYCREAGGDPALMGTSPPRRRDMSPARGRHALSTRSPNIDASLLSKGGASADRMVRSERRRHRCRHHRQKGPTGSADQPSRLDSTRDGGQPGRPSPTDAVMEFVDACKVRGIPDDVVHEHAMFMIEAIRESMEHAAERHRLQQDVDASQYDASLGSWLASIGSHQTEPAGRASSSSRRSVSRVVRGGHNNSSTATGTISTAGLSPVAHTAAGHSPTRTPPPPSMPPPADAVDSSIVSLSDSAMRRSIVRGAFSGSAVTGRTGTAPRTPEAPPHPPPADALTPHAQHHPPDVTVVSPLSDPRVGAVDHAASSPPVGGNVGASYQAMVSSSHVSGGSVWRGSAIGSATRRRESSVVSSGVLCDTGTQCSPPAQPQAAAASRAQTPEQQRRCRDTPQGGTQAPPWSPPGHAVLTAQRKYTPSSQARAKVAGTTPQVDSPRRCHSPATRVDVSSAQGIRDSALRNARVRTEHAQCAASSARKQVVQLKRSSSAASRHVERQRAARERQEERKAELARRAALPAASLRRPSASRARSSSLPSRQHPAAAGRSTADSSHDVGPTRHDVGDREEPNAAMLKPSVSYHNGNSKMLDVLSNAGSPEAVAPSPQRPVVVRRELFGTTGGPSARHTALRPTVRNEDVDTLRSALRATSNRSPSGRSRDASARPESGAKAVSSEPVASATVSSPTATDASLPRDDGAASSPPAVGENGRAGAFLRVGVVSPTLDVRSEGRRDAKKAEGSTPPPPPLPLTDDTARASSSSPAPGNGQPAPSRRADGYPSPPKHSPRQNPTASVAGHVDPTRPIDWRPLRSFSPVGPCTEAFLSRAARSIRAASGEQQRAASRTPLRRAGASASPARSAAAYSYRQSPPQPSRAAPLLSATTMSSTTEGSAATTTVTRTVNAFRARQEEPNGAVDDALSEGTSIGESTIADMVI